MAKMGKLVKIHENGSKKWRKSGPFSEKTVKNSQNGKNGDFLHSQPVSFAKSGGFDLLRIVVSKSGGFDQNGY